MMDRLARYGADLGLGAPTGPSDSTAKRAGFCPPRSGSASRSARTPRARASRWAKPGTPSSARVRRATLLQMATLYAAIANGGKLWLPQIVDHVEAPDGQVLEEFSCACGVRWPCRPRAWPSYARRSWASSTSPRAPPSRSTRRRSRSPGRRARRRCTGGAAILREATTPTTTPGSWASRRRPAAHRAGRLAVEHGGHGGDVAAPLAMEIVNNYFDTVAPDEKNAPRLGLPRRRSRAGTHDETAVVAPPSAAESP